MALLSRTLHAHIVYYLISVAFPEHGVGWGDGKMPR